MPHTGALFLDELAQFSPQVLDTLREPMQEGRITISRAGTLATYPARFTLIAAMNRCACEAKGVRRYRAHRSRIDEPFST